MTLERELKASKRNPASHRASFVRAVNPPQPHPLHQLQQSLGNRAFGRFVQAKLDVSQPGDQFEEEADMVANQVMQTPPQLQRACTKCEEDEPDTIQRVAKDESKVNVGPSLATTLNSRLNQGRELPADTRAQMESALGAGFPDVRVHTDDHAASLNRSLHASAFTYGRDIFFGKNQFNPQSASGKHLLAHELTHVVQQRGGKSPAIQRFHLPHGTDAAHQTDESPRIAPTFADLLSTLKAIISACTIPSTFGDTVNMELFVQKAGGRPVSATIDQALGTTSTPTVASMLNYRYQFTCRCGFVDMRHFLQLMYVSHFLASAFPGVDANQAATKKGRDHELKSESESRFGPEDTPSNALGAFTGTRLAGTPRPADLLSTIETMLRRCAPVDFSSLSAASQNQIKHHYGDLTPDPTPKVPGDLIPLHQNQSALPDILGIAECAGKERSFPFKLDMSDPHRKTISSMAFGSGATGLTSDTDIRDFVATQRTEIIKGLSAAEKVRLVQRLLSGWVSDDDLDAVKVIYNNSTDPEKAQIKAAINPEDLSDLGQRTRLKLLLG